MDQIFISGIEAMVIIGVDEWERINPQTILVNIILDVDLRKAGESDNLEDTVDYRALTYRVKQLAETAKRLTVEALATDIAHLCLEDLRVSKVKIRVEKPGALNCVQSIGVEVERTQTIS